MDNEKLVKVFEKFDHKELANKCVEMSIELFVLKDRWNELKKDIEDKVEIIEEQYMKNKMSYNSLFIAEMESRKIGYERILKRMQELDGDNND